MHPAKGGGWEVVDVTGQVKRVVDVFDSEADALARAAQLNAGRGTADVSSLKGRQLANEFTGNMIKRFKRQMKAQGGYGDFPPIKIAEIDGKKIIIDGHHRARAAGAAGIKDVPVEIIDVPPGVASKYFQQAAEAAERLGLPF